MAAAGCCSELNTRVAGSNASARRQLHAERVVAWDGLLHTFQPTFHVCVCAREQHGLDSTPDATDCLLCDLREVE